LKGGGHPAELRDYQAVIEDVVGEFGGRGGRLAQTGDDVDFGFVWEQRKTLEQGLGSGPKIGLREGIISGVLTIIHRQESDLHFEQPSKNIRDGMYKKGGGWGNFEVVEGRNRGVRRQDTNFTN
jgi:hypothetical protein